ncbi:hypothetical protein ACWEOZ_33110 [Actinoplanes sp. NPDC004185]
MRNARRDGYPQRVARVTVPAGFSAGATAAIGRSLLVTDWRLLLVSHDVSRLREGLARRTVRTADAVLEYEVIELVHGCVSCTLREDVLPTSLRLARERPDSNILLALPPVVEPGNVAAVCAHAGAEDRRGVADVVVRQVEYADTIVVWGFPQHDALDDAPGSPPGPPTSASATAAPSTAPPWPPGCAAPAATIRGPRASSAAPSRTSRSGSTTRPVSTGRARCCSAPGARSTPYGCTRPWAS